MATDEAATTNGAAPASERESQPSPPAETEAKEKDEELEYEVEFATPFGKLEFEFEPISRKKKKDAKRQAKKEEEAAKKAAALALKAQEKAAKRGGRGVFGTLLIIFAVMAVVGGLIALAYWLFARPGEEAEEAVPPEFANIKHDDEAQGLVAKARSRVQQAVRAGRKASRQAQAEQEQRFREMAG